MIEVEVKVAITNPARIEEQLISMGFLKGDLVKESDLYFDNREEHFREKDKALRIRKCENLTTGKCESLLTYKGPKMDQVSMTRKELETTLEDGRKTEEILNELGYRSIYPVIKMRQYYHQEGRTACVDRVEGLGEYLELEQVVEREEEKEPALLGIFALLKELGYEKEEVIKTSYLSLLQKKSLRWVSLGCGVIANELAAAMEKKGRKLYGIANRTYEKAVAFAEKYGVEKVYKTIDEVFDDEKADIIYISTPHNTHIPFLRKALAAGKHVLCEKSITLNSRELMEAADLAKKNNVVLGEAMTIFHMPLYKRLKEIMETGVLGELRLIQMNFGSYKEYDMENRFFNRNLAGGALLDIGVYALSFVRWFMSSKPTEIISQVKYAPSGVDEQASILLKNKEEEMAAIILSLHAKQPKRGTIAFDKGYIEIYEYPRGEKAVITYTEDGRKEEIAAGATKDALSYEVEDMEAAVSGKADEMHLDYTKDVMEMMTEIRMQWGMTYPEEEA